MTEAGFPGQDSDTLLGVLLPAQTPEPIVAKLHQAIADAVRQLDTQGKMATLRFDPVVNTPAEFAARAHETESESGLFSISDRPAHEALGIWREIS